MISIPVQIALHGLIALVPTSDNHMTALVMDEQTPPAMECMAAHVVTLNFFPGAGQCFDAGCDTADDRSCTCTDSDLANKEISLSVSPAVTSVPVSLGKIAAHPLPADVIEAGDFSYVANLAQPPLGLTLNPQFLGPTPPPLLFARFLFQFDTMTACDLAGRFDQGVLNFNSLSFRTLGAVGSHSEASQVLAQTVIGQLAVTDTSTVTLHITDFGGANDHPMTLQLHDSRYLIEISNEPAMLDPDSPCDDGVGRHFGLFDDLALVPPAWPNRLIPHVRPTQFIGEDGFIPAVCAAVTKGVMDRPICPMATFN